MSRTSRRLAQALAEVEALRKGWPEARASLDILATENARLRAALTHIAGIGRETACIFGREFEFARRAALKALGRDQTG